MNKKNNKNVESNSASRLISKLVNRRHPEYSNLVPQWRFFGETYAGGREWFKKNIFKYYREGDTEYEERVERSYRFNHTKEVVDLINKYLFKQHIQRATEAPESVKSFWKNATSGGVSINELAKQISKNCSIYGRIGIVVDRDSFDSSTTTLKDAKQKDVRTYAYIVNPENMLDYSFDSQGDLNWILIQESYRDDEDPFGDVNNQILTRYRLWTKNEWFLFVPQDSNSGKQSIELSSQGAHNLGVVPVILADNFLSDDKYTSSSLINDIAYLDRAVANYLSNLDNIIQDQTFSQLVMPAQNVMSGSDEEEQLYEMGTKRIFLYDAGGSNRAPEYIAPDPSQAHLILEAVSKIIREIYNSVGLSSERTNKDNAVAQDNSSGVAKAYDFERVNALLLAKADSLEIIENKIAKLVALWNGDKFDDEKPLVLYPDNFDTRGLYDEFDISARLMLVDAPRAIRQEQMRSVVKKLFPLLDAKLQKKIEKEVDEWLNPETILEDISMRTSQNNLSEPTNTLYKNNGGKGDATEKANGSAIDNKQPIATKRQGQVTKNTK